MIRYIKGILEHKDIDYIIVDVNGIGFKIFTSLSTIQSLKEVGSEVKIHTYLQVREDNLSLFGFTSAEELKMLELLLKVSGVGPKVAVSLISNLSPSKFSLAIITDDVKTLSKVPGIGKKTAQRIILELKDKIKKEQKDITLYSEDNATPDTGIKDTKASEAIAALMVLGYTALEASRAVSAVYSDELDLEDIIKSSLKKLI
ncbi:MAG: Holliday junction branch migration protein RuvA [Clostridiaceae bacterium]|jgi:Holliday junction DNA helicase RuvA|nr:Holliday junction branch migration protein RuvA [Clostridiaceae bacterium]